jgi:hypothetical protein
MGNVNESIFSGKSVIIPMAEVMYIERDLRDKYKDAISIVMRGTTWNIEIDSYNNFAYLRHEEAKSFLECWCHYRDKLELDTLCTDHHPEIIDGVHDALDGLTIKSS